MRGSGPTCCASRRRGGNCAGPARRSSSRACRAPAGSIARAPHLPSLRARRRDPPRHPDRPEPPMSSSPETSSLHACASSCRPLAPGRTRATVSHCPLRLIQSFSGDGCDQAITAPSGSGRRSVPVRRPQRQSSLTRCNGTRLRIGPCRHGCTIASAACAEGLVHWSTSGSQIPRNAANYPQSRSGARLYPRFESRVLPQISRRQF